MGKNISATLAFGVDYGDEPPFNSGTEDDPDTDLGEYLAKRSGMVNPYTLVPKEVNEGSYDAFKEWEASNPKWAAQKRAWYDLTHRLENEAPVEIDSYGTLYDSYQRYYVLIVKGWKFEGDWCSPTKVHVGSMWQGGSMADSRVAAASDKLHAAKKFCEENGLPSFDKPSWLLYALEG